MCPLWLSVSTFHFLFLSLSFFSSLSLSTSSQPPPNLQPTAACCHHHCKHHRHHHHRLLLPPPLLQLKLIDTNLALAVSSHAAHCYICSHWAFFCCLRWWRGAATAAAAAARNLKGCRQRRRGIQWIMAANNITLAGSNVLPTSREYSFSKWTAATIDHRHQGHHRRRRRHRLDVVRPPLELSSSEATRIISVRAGVAVAALGRVCCFRRQHLVLLTQHCSQSRMIFFHHFFAATFWWNEKEATVMIKIPLLLLPKVTPRC